MILYFTYIYIFDNLSSEVFGLKQPRKKNSVSNCFIRNFKIMIRHEQLFNTYCELDRPTILEEKPLGMSVREFLGFVD